MASAPPTAYQGECVLCGKCLEVCPLFQATAQEEFSPRAKADLLRALHSTGHDLSESGVRRLAGMCLGCQRCREVCPQNVDVPQQIQDLKAQHPGWRSWIWGRLVTNAPRLYPLLAAWGRQAPGVAPPGRQDLLRSLGQGGDVPARIETGTALAPGVRAEGPWVLFPGCAARFAKPHWLAAAQQLLDQAGAALAATPDWACCGFTLGQAGLPGEQRRLQEKNIELWREWGRPRVAIFCATCLAGLQGYAQYAAHWQDDAEREQWLQGLTPLWHFVSALAEPDRRVLAGKHYVAHSPCHSPAGEGPWLESFLRAHGAQVQALDHCCGLGGSMQLEHPRMCSRVSSAFWASVAPETEAVLTGCAGCVLHLGATAPRPIQVGHWLELFVTQ